MEILLILQDNVPFHFFTLTSFYDFNSQDYRSVLEVATQLRLLWNAVFHNLLNLMQHFYNHT